MSHVTSHQGKGLMLFCTPPTAPGEAGRALTDNPKNRGLHNSKVKVKSLKLRKLLTLA